MLISAANNIELIKLDVSKVIGKRRRALNVKVAYELTLD